MTTDNGERDSDNCPDERGKWTDRSGTSQTSAERQFSRTDWIELDSNPDATEDLGYRVTEWNTFETPDNSDQLMFLPDDESLLKDDAFIVADESDLRELDDCC